MIHDRTRCAFGYLQKSQSIDWLFLVAGAGLLHRRAADRSFLFEAFT